MNLYLRYFDDEVVVATADEGYQFLCEVTNEVLDTKHLDMLREYMDSPMNFTKRFKMRPRVYYVGIKTDAATLEEFKQRGQQLAEERAAKASNATEASQGRTSRFADEQPGWYEGKLLFKRVVFNVNTNRNEYIDTEFVAVVKAYSIEDLYHRLCEHLQSRGDVDPRSQLPSIKGKNFQYKFIGMALPEDIDKAVHEVLANEDMVDIENGAPAVIAL